MKCAICGEYAGGWDLEMNRDGEFEFRCSKHKEVKNKNENTKVLSKLQ